MQKYHNNRPVTAHSDKEGVMVIYEAWELHRDDVVVLLADHMVAMKEMQEMIAFLIAFVPDMTERQK